MKAVKILLLIVAVWCSCNSAFGQTWTQTGLSNVNWTCFASSADGNTLVAEPTFLNGLIFISTNGGVTWNTNTLPSFYFSGTQYGMSFVSVASSADGTKMAGVDVGGFICTSTNSGTSWITNNAPAVSWYSIASSTDGAKLVAVGGNGLGPIYVSTNSGVIWLPTIAPSNNWRSVASSADGTKLVAGCSGTNSIYVSTNSGNTWMTASTPTNKQWVVASSADGTKMVAAYFSEPSTNSSGYAPGHIFTSTDSGSTWGSNTLVSSFFGSVAMSADGSKIVAATEDPVVFVSTNFGGSWESNSLPGGGSYFQSVAMSADGGKLITGSASLTLSLGGLGLSYMSQTVYAPQLNISPVSNNLALSWIIPSTNFVLQQSADLISWVDLTNTPALNLTNLQNEVTLSPTNSVGFFRLSTP